VWAWRLRPVSRICKTSPHYGVLAQHVGRPAAEGLLPPAWCDDLHIDGQCLDSPGFLLPPGVVGTAPGGSKKLNQVKRARNTKTKSLKRVRVQATASDAEED